MAHWTEETYIESPAVIGESMHRGVDRAEDDVANLLALLDEHGVKPEQALDVASGIGRHSIELRVSHPILYGPANENQELQVRTRVKSQPQSSLLKRNGHLTPGVNIAG